jgi:hypothetical protein
VLKRLAGQVVGLEPDRQRLDQALDGAHGGHRTADALESRTISSARARPAVHGSP